MEQLVLQLEGASMAWWRYLFTIHNETVKWEWRPLHTAGVYISQRWIFMNHGVMTCSVIGSNISNDTAGIKSLHIHAVGQYFLAVLFFSLSLPFPSLPPSSSESWNVFRSCRCPWCHNQLLAGLWRGENQTECYSRCQSLWLILYLNYKRFSEWVKGDVFGAC